MTNIAIVSPFRNSAPIAPYIKRAMDLEWPDHWLRWYLIEGDSDDDTYRELLTWAEIDGRVTVHKCDTGLPHYGSQVHPERFYILATVFNTGLNAVMDDEWADYIMFLPSDVYYDGTLIQKLIAWGKDIIAPMFWVKGGGNTGYRFYDIWGFIQDGVPWKPHGFEWYNAHFPLEPVEMDTIGGCKLIRRAVLEAGCRYTPEEVDHGLCKAARAAGFSVWADPTTHIVHGPERMPIKV